MIVHAVLWKTDMLIFDYSWTAQIFDVRPRMWLSTKASNAVDYAYDDNNDNYHRILVFFRCFIAQSIWSNKRFPEKNLCTQSRSCAFLMKEKTTLNIFNFDNDINEIRECTPLWDYCIGEALQAATVALLSHSKEAIFVTGKPIANRVWETADGFISYNWATRTCSLPVLIN